MLVLLLMTNHFAAVVSDNDGSAFISKAEFDSLKNDFQSQLNQYNSNIDNKIDVAISSYLTGTKMETTSDKDFDIFGNKKILITNTKNINNLKFGKVGIDWDINIGQTGWRANATNSAVGTVKLTRIGDSNYEAFIIDKDTNKFKYWGDGLKIDTKVNFALQKAITTGLSSYNTNEQIQNVKLRWGAHAYNYAPHGETETRDSVGSIRWSNYFGKDTFFAIYASGINWGNLFWGIDPSTNDVYRSNISTVEITNEKVLWIIDDSDVSTQVWVYDPEKDPKVLTVSDGVNYINTDRTSTFPSDAGITGTVSIASVNIDFRDAYDSTNYPDRYKLISVSKDIEWTDVGSYNNVSSPASGSSTPWSEFHLVTNSNAPSTMVNDNFTSAQISEYASYGFHGYITEGLPLGVFKDNTSIKFTLDTTGAGRNLIFAVKNSAFDTSNIEDLSDDADVVLKVDGVEYQDVCTMSASSHTIEIENMKNQALFVKIIIPRTESSKDRCVITWPSSYTLKDKN